MIVLKHDDSLFWENYAALTTSPGYMGDPRSALVVGVVTRLRDYNDVAALITDGMTGTVTVKTRANVQFVVRESDLEQITLEVRHPDLMLPEVTLDEPTPDTLYVLENPTDGTFQILRHNGEDCIKAYHDKVSALLYAGNTHIVVETTRQDLRKHYGFPYIDLDGQYPQAL